MTNPEFGRSLNKGVMNAQQEGTGGCIIDLLKWMTGHGSRERRPFCLRLVVWIFARIAGIFNAFATGAALTPLLPHKNGCHPVPLLCIISIMPFAERNVRPQPLNVLMKTMRIQTCLAALSGLFCFSVTAVTAESVIAQSAADSAAHRRLELPRNGSSDLQQQMFLLKQLQTMLSGNTPNGSSGKPPLTSEQLQNLQDAVKQFGSNLPKDMLKNIPPELVSQAMSDPKMRQQVQQMLQQFSKDRQLPEGTGNSGFPMPPADDRKTRPNGIRRGLRPASRSGSIRPRQPDESRNTSPQQPSRTSDQADLQQQLEDLLKKAAENQNGRRPNPDVSRSVGQSNQTDERPTAAEPLKGEGSRSQFPTDSDGWDRLLEKLIKEQRGLPDDTPSNTNRTGAVPSPSNPNRANMSRAQSVGRGSNAAGGTRPDDALSVAEFLKQMKGMLPPDSPSQAPAQSVRSGGNNTGRPRTTDRGVTAADGGVAAADDTAREEVRRLQEKVKSDLQNNGLQQTLKRIVRDAQKKAKQSRPSAGGNGSGVASAGGSDGLNGSLIRAVDGIRKDLVEMVKDGDFKPASPANNQRPSAGGPSQTAKSRSMFSGLEKSTGEFFSELVAPSSLPAPSPATLPTASSAAVLPEGSWGVWILLLLAVGLITAVLLWRSGLLDPAGSAARGGALLTARDIQSKRDIVRAFHQMALQPSRQAETWWTHQMVSDEISEQLPERTYQIRVLAELYEQARYLPDAEEFSPEQIREARTALKQCVR